MNLSTEKEQGVHIIHIEGDLDASSSILLDTAMYEAISTLEKHILINCAKLNYISSAGLGVFMSHLSDLEEKNIFFGLYGMSEKVKNVFEILGLQQLINNYTNKEEALQAIGV
ncbi:anti-sigma F factor antagonist [bacterium 336/3]|jgi:anti-sigma B factor antagonist|nr:anti-sigma F factor antagonist [bacterium 336/3]